MKKAILLMVMALAPVLVAAQEAKEQTIIGSQTDQTVKAFQVKPGNVDRIQSALSMIVGNNNVRADRDLNMLVVKASAQLMPAVEEIVKRLDVAAPPPRNIEFTIYLLEVAREPLPNSAIPPDLQPTVNQLRTALGYQGVRVADKTIMQLRPGDSAQYAGRLAIPEVQPPPSEQQNYELSFQTKLLPEEKPPVVRLDSLRLRAMAGRSFNPVLITSIDVREGQKAVVGKMTGGGDRTLVLVLSAKLLN